MKKRDLVDKIISDVNSAVRLFRKGSYELKPERFERLLLSGDTSVEKKKKELMKELYDALVKTCSVNLGRISKERLVASLKNNLRIVRKLVKKINDINYYLSTTFLEEADLIRNKSLIKRKHARRLIEVNFPIKQKELEKLEHTVYRMIERIISLDSRLLKSFRKKEAALREEKAIEISDLEEILRAQAELLYHIEAKLPPPSRIDSRLIEKPRFDYWVATLLALTASLNDEYGKEQLIFQKLKKDQLLKKKIDMKIRHIAKEKGDMLKLKEGRILMAEKIGEMDQRWMKYIRDWGAAADL